MRSGCVAYPQATRPFTHECPWLAFPSLCGVIRTTCPPFISASNAQPTPQYAQGVITLCSGVPASTPVLSMSVAVGHACTQAPHETHSDSMKGSIWPGETTELNPRVAIVR